SRLGPAMVAKHIADKFRLRHYFVETMIDQAVIPLQVSAACATRLALHQPVQGFSTLSVDLSLPAVGGRLRLTRWPQAIADFIQISLLTVKSIQRGGKDCANLLDAPPAFQSEATRLKAGGARPYPAPAGTVLAPPVARSNIIQRALEPALPAFRRKSYQYVPIQGAPRSLITDENCRAAS
ncbi:hypothetical protein, partial [Sphingobium yanoikuyae]